jgi:hypothetical protein
MDTIEIIAQGVGILGMIANFLSFQQKEQKRVVAFQFFSAALFGINYLMLGAYMGALLNIIGVIRAIVFINREKLKAEHPAWLVFFIIAFVGTYPLVFTVFGKEPILKNFIIELLPVIAMILATISYRFTRAKDIRRFGVFSSPMWLIYNCFCFSIGAILSEILNLISIIIGIIRFDLKKEQESEKADS